MKITDNAQGMADNLIGALNDLKQKQRMSMNTLVSAVETWIRHLPKDIMLSSKLESGENFMISEEKYRNFVTARFSEINARYREQLQDISTFIKRNIRNEETAKLFENYIIYDERILWLLNLSNSTDPFFESIFRALINGPNYHDFL